MLTGIRAVQVLFDYPPSFVFDGKGDEQRFLLAEQPEEQRSSTPSTTPSHTSRRFPDHPCPLSERYEIQPSSLDGIPQPDLDRLPVEFDEIGNAMQVLKMDIPNKGYA